MNKVKRKCTNWEKIFANHISNEGLIPKIHKELTQLKNKKKQPNQKIGRGCEQTFFQKRYAGGQQAHEKMFNITISEMQIKTTMRYHLTPIRMAITNKTGNKCCRGSGEKGTLIHCRSANWYSHYGKQYGNSSKN